MPWTNPISRYYADCAAGTLPNIAFVDPPFRDGGGGDGLSADEHPLGDVRLGQAFMADAVNAFIRSPNYRKGALFIIYDEWGGFFDHARPPRVIDDRASRDQNEDFAQMGFRIPAVTVSPYTRRRGEGFRVDHGIYGHESILKLISYRFGLGYLNKRHRYARNIGHSFDWETRPDFDPVSLPDPPEVATNPCENGGGDIAATDSEQAHANDLASLEEAAYRYGVPVYEAKPHVIFRQPDTVVKAIRRERAERERRRRGAAPALAFAGHGDAASHRGEQVEGQGPPLEVENPTTEETIASVGTASPEQVDAAIAAAREGARDWAATPAVERAELLHEVARLLRDRTDELARAMTLEGGKPLIENSDEVGWTAAAFDYYAEMGRNFAGRVIPSIESTQLAMVLKEPIGVVGAIVPWNYPLLLLSWKLAPALAAGNTVVCKPSELTPVSTLMLAPCLEPLPAGAVALLAGAGDVGESIVSDERVDCVAFTGSVETGKRIAARCAERVARINLEMGGKDPFIVCADVAGDVEVAARGGAWAAYLNAGQVCTSAERFYVHESVYDDYLEAFVDLHRVARGRRPARRRRPTSARWPRRPSGRRSWIR